METYATWARLFELHRYYSWVVDRFHLSTMAWQRIHAGHDEDFGWLEDRLEPLGFHVVLCTRRPETFEAARAERLLVSGNPSQYDDLGVFLHEQTVLRRPGCRVPPARPRAGHERRRPRRRVRTDRGLDGSDRRVVGAGRRKLTSRRVGLRPPIAQP